MEVFTFRFSQGLDSKFVEILQIGKFQQDNWGEIICEKWCNC